MTIEGLTMEDERILHDLCVIELGRVQDHPDQRDYAKSLVSVAVKLERSMGERAERGNSLLASLLTPNRAEES